jgi:hypothetical protein
MTAIIAMQESIGAVDRRSERASKAGLVERAREILTICSRANDAAHTYEKLKAMSDHELAKRGLKRADLARAAFDRLTERS